VPEMVRSCEGAAVSGSFSSVVLTGSESKGNLT
jgi:hypothetical protein